MEVVSKQKNFNMPFILLIFILTLKHNNSQINKDFTKILKETLPVARWLIWWITKVEGRFRKHKRNVTLVIFILLLNKWDLKNGNHNFKHRTKINQSINKWINKSNKRRQQIHKTRKLVLFDNLIRSTSKTSWSLPMSKLIILYH